jgi:hypothetical protein
VDAKIIFGRMTESIPKKQDVKVLLALLNQWRKDLEIILKWLHKLDHVGLGYVSTD